MFLSNVFEITCVIIATLIGAGFATGQEIMQFFNIHGANGIWAIVLMGSVLTTIVMMTLDIIQKYKINNYDEFMDVIAPPWLAKILDFANTIFLFMFFVVMVAGSGAFFEEYLHINFYVGTSIFGLLCYLALNKNIKGVITVSNILVPFIILGIIAVGLFIYNNLENPVFIPQKSGYGWIWSGFIYVGFNILSEICILSSMKSVIKDRKTAIVGSIIPCIILTFMALIIYWIIFSHYSTAKGTELPILEIITKLQISWGWIYYLILISSIYTTAVSDGYSFLTQICKDNKKYKYVSLVLCILAIPLSGIGFSKLVGTVYPIVGVVGVLEMLLIVIKSIY